MHYPELPRNESERLMSLHHMLLLDTPDEEIFDRITRIAQAVFQVPIALVSLVDASRQWFKSCIGLPVRETDRNVSFCGHTILGHELFIIPDATRDPRFADNPLVTGAPFIRFYAGYPLRNPEGHTVGTLCIISQLPRELSELERRLLEDLGQLAQMAMRERQLTDSQLFLLEELAHAKHDALIDKTLRVWNSKGFKQILTRELEGVRDYGRPLCVAELTLENYLTLLRSDGIVPANELLTEVVVRIRHAIPPSMTLARTSEDKLMLCWSGESGDIPLLRMHALQDKINTAPYTLLSLGKEVQPCLTLGLVFIDTQHNGHLITANDLILAAAHNAMLAQARHVGAYEASPFIQVSH